jgi:hypothetical protein
MHEEHDALTGKAVAPFKASIPHMQLDAWIDSRDHECLGDDSLRVRRRGHEPGDQQGGRNSKIAHRVPLQAVIVLASAIAICRRARATFATRTIPPEARRALDFTMHYNSCLADVMGFFGPARCIC